MKNTLWMITLLCITFQTFRSDAQTMRWGISGGSADGTAGAPDETIVDMATDRNGNVYILSSVFETALTVAGHPRTGYGVEDIMLASFKCDGTYRWSKIFGSVTADIGNALRIDSLGGVYVAGYIFSHHSAVHIDTDTTISTDPSGYRTMFLLKYDTAGVFKWAAMPEADTTGIAAASHNQCIDMDIDNLGNVYLFVNVLPGLYGGSYVASAQGYYIFKYSNTGAFISATPLQMDYTGGEAPILHMARDHGNGHYYITGDLSWGGSLFFNGTHIVNPVFIGAFDPSGNFLWKHENTSGYGQGFGRAVTDATHNIYVAGMSQMYVTPDTFNGYVVHNTVWAYGNSPLIVKMDVNGNNVWANNGSCNHVTYGSYLALCHDTVSVAGAYNGKLVYPGADSLYHPTAVGEGYDVFIVQASAGTGAFTRLDTITSAFGSFEYASAIATDNRGNVYVGGNMSDDVYANTDTLTTMGGGSDFFLAKYGYDNCTAPTTTTKVSHNEMPADITVYPNPVSATLFINNVAPGTRFVLYDLYGRALREGTIAGRSHDINVAALPAGPCMLMLTDSSGNAKKMVLMKL